MDAATEAALGHAREHRFRSVGELKELVRFKTISAQLAREPDLRACARWLAAHLRSIGIANASVLPTGGWPVVYGEWLGRPGAPTVLLYGHYDVQPADEQWQSRPFEPVIRGDNLYGRGVSDDKGQLFVHVKCLESWLRSSRSLPLNVKVLLEGEEEIGSPNLGAWLHRHARALAADAVVISDMPMLGPDRPAITYAMRGALSLRLEVQRAGPVLHSGLYGGAVPNAAQEICRLLAGLHDDNHRIAVPGLYDRVRPVSRAERRYLAAVGPSESELGDLANVAIFVGEPGYSAQERTTLRPSLTVTSCRSGFQGEGGKAAVPNEATADLDLRLVPDQDMREVEQCMRAHLLSAAAAGTITVLRRQFAVPPVLAPRSHPAVLAAREACRRTFGRWPAFIRCGGSLPAVTILERELRAPVVLLGFALPDDRVHGPDEKFHLPTFEKGVATSITLLAALARRLARPAPVMTVAGGGGFP